MILSLETIGAEKTVYFLLTSIKLHLRAYRETVPLKTKKALVRPVKYVTATPFEILFYQDERL
jgi:hypothetical protein